MRRSTMSGGIVAQPASWAWSAATVRMASGAVPIHRRHASASSSIVGSNTCAKSVRNGLSQPTVTVRAGCCAGMVWRLIRTSVVVGDVGPCRGVGVGGLCGAGAPGVVGDQVAVPGLQLHAGFAPQPRTDAGGGNGPGTGVQARRGRWPLLLFRLFSSSVAGVA